MPQIEQTAKLDKSKETLKAGAHNKSSAKPKGGAKGGTTPEKLTATNIALPTGPAPFVTRKGRPADYLPEYGEVVERWMAMGYSLTATAGIMGFNRATFSDWIEKFPDFAASVKNAQCLRAFKLETDLLNACDGPTVTSRIFALKNAAAEEDDLNSQDDASTPLSRLYDAICGSKFQPVENPPAIDAPMTDDEIT
jgi:hypothetical protein